MKIPSFISRRLLFPVLDRLRGRKTLTILHDLESSQWLEQPKIQELQWQAIRQLLKEASAYVPYYRRLFKESGYKPEDVQTPQDFAHFPILTKEIVRANLNDLVNERSDISSLALSATGGSTGIPMPYYHDEFHGQFSNAITLRNNHWTGWDIGEPLAELWGSDFDLKLAASLKGKLRNLIDNRLVLSAWDLGEARMGEYFNLIQQFRPQLVTGYAHALYLFSCYVVSRNLQLKPKAVISSAETLFDYQREMMEKAFQCPILNRYGCREVGNIAHQCLKTGGMHINAEMIYLEIIKDNNPCPPGEVGEIVVTCLTNRGMPFIRYATGDLGTIGEGSCTCGRGLPLIKTVKGRVQDVLVGTSGQLVTGELFPHLLKDFSRILEYQVIQQERKVLALNLVVCSPLTSTEKARIEEVIHRYLGGDMTVVWNYVDNILKPPSGKHRTVISNISKNIGGFRQPE